MRQPLPVALVGLAGGGRRGRRARPRVGVVGVVGVVDRRAGHRVGLRGPVEQRVVDHRGGDLLADDAVHHPGDHPLPGQPARPIGVGVVRLQLVAQPPVADQPQAGGEQPPAVGGEQVVHVDVVVADVGVGRGEGGADRLVDVGRHPLRKGVAEPRLGPLAAAPAHPLGQPLGEGGGGEVEERDEGDPVGEEVVGDVGAGAVSGEPAVEREQRPQVEVGAAAEVADQRGQVAADPLEGELEAVEGLVQGLAPGEVLGLDEGAEGLGVAVLRAPEAEDRRPPRARSAPPRPGRGGRRGRRPRSAPPRRSGGRRRPAATRWRRRGRPA